MPAPSFDPKNLRGTLELDYFRRPRPLLRWYALANLLALGLAVAGIGWSLWPGTPAVYQAGPVTTAHAFVGHDCRQCHDRPFATAARLVPDEPSISSCSDAACSRCHPGGPHQPPNAPQSVPAEHCTDCHREHHGRDFLARVADDHCLGCHRSGNIPKANTRRFEPVDDFAHHPQFALWRKPTADPGTVKFNHQKHLQLTPDQLRKASAERGRDLAPQDARLAEQQCGACHVADAAGRYLEPIRYEQHCAACHPLNVAIKGAEATPALAEAVQAFARTPAPHPHAGESAATVRAVLRERFLTFAQQHPAVLQPAQETKRLPWSPLHGPAVQKRELDWVNDQVRHAESKLFVASGGCVSCHEETGRRSHGLPDFGKPAIPSRWLPHSVFRHDAHRMMRCEECHSAVTDVRTSTMASDVLMPKLDLCRQCHGSTSNATGSARADCIECHRYHHDMRR